MSWPENKNRKDMYKMYCSGLSLEQVGKAFGVTRQSVYGLFKYHNMPTRPKQKPLNVIYFNGARYTKRNTGYFGKTTGERTLLHRDVWEKHKGAIPVGWDIHHIDGDKEHNSIKNLECLPKAEHTSKYSPHNNQYTKGKRR